MSNNTIDYGTVHFNALKQNEFTVLDEKQLDFASTCDALAQVFITAQSGHGTSTVNQECMPNGHSLFLPWIRARKKGTGDCGQYHAVE